MKDSVLEKITSHLDREEIVSQLTLGRSPKEVNDFLSQKYTNIDKSLVIGVVSLTKFKNEYLNFYLKIQADALTMRNANSSPSQNFDAVAKELVQSNNHYQEKLNSYIDKEIDIKDMAKRLVIICEDRIGSLFNKIHDNPNNTKLDYILIQYLNSLSQCIDKLDRICNGSPDKIVQNNQINIQILDQHSAIFQKIIREVIARLDYDTSLLFVDMMEQEFAKLKPASINSALPVEFRTSELAVVEGNLQKLDIPSF